MGNLNKVIGEPEVNPSALQFNRLNITKDGVKYLKRLRTKQGEYKDIFTLEGELAPIKCGYTTKEMMLYLKPYKGPVLVEKGPVPEHPEYLIEKIFFNFEIEKYIFQIS